LRFCAKRRHPKFRRVHPARLRFTDLSSEGLQLKPVGHWHAGSLIHIGLQSPDLWTANEQNERSFFLTDAHSGAVRQVNSDDVQFQHLREVYKTGAKTGR
jgi:hypothetical protein